MSTAFTSISLLALLLLGAAAHSEAKRLATPKPQRPVISQLKRMLSARPKKDSRETNGAAYSSWKGQDPGGAGDAMTWYFSEASSTSNYNGNYYNDGTLTIGAGDMHKGGWSGAIDKESPDGPRVVAAVSTNFDPEFSSSRGVHAVSGTYEGARAVAGSNSFSNAAADAVVVAQIEAYGPTANAPTSVDPNGMAEKRRSVSFTNIAPNSASQAGIGNGPAAVSSGYEVASTARAARDKPLPVTMGHREAGAGPWKTYGTKRRQLKQQPRRMLQRGSH